MTPVDQEVAAIRTAAALSALPDVTCLRLRGDAAYDALDRLCPTDLHLRDGQVRQSLLLREDGVPLADLTLALDDESFLLLAEGAPRGVILDHVRTHLPPGDVALEDLGDSHVLLSLNGPFAWEVLAAIEGEEILGMPYLSLYARDGGAWYLRAGKTGEFGYDLLVPAAQATALWDRLREAGAACDLAVAGTGALWTCALENWFFNIHREGQAGLSPLELGLTWRVSFQKQYVGAEALLARRRAGVARRVTAIEADAPLRAADAIVLGEQTIGTILHAERSPTLGTHIGVGLLDVAYAYAGIDRYAAARDGIAAPIRTVSAPFVNNLSLYVSPQRHSYARRGEIRYPGPSRSRAQAEG